MIIECQTYGSITRADGKITLRDMFIDRDGKRFAITVASKPYIDQITKLNASFPISMQADSNLFPIDNLDDGNFVCETLGSIPFETLSPFLTELPSETP